MTREIISKWLWRVAYIVLAVLTERGVPQAANLLTFLLWIGALASIFLVVVFSLADPKLRSFNKERLALNKNPQTWWLVVLQLIPVYFGWWVTTVVVALGTFSLLFIRECCKEIVAEVDA